MTAGLLETAKLKSQTVIQKSMAFRNICFEKLPPTPAQVSKCNDTLFSTCSSLFFYRPLRLQISFSHSHTHAAQTRHEISHFLLHAVIKIRKKLSAHYFNHSVTLIFVCPLVPVLTFKIYIRACNLSFIIVSSTVYNLRWSYFCFKWFHCSS